jgi:predicted aldo/keto reductase-like oxidoreductase
VPGDTIEHFKEYIARARAETVVHTIGFSSEAGKEPLMQIAKNHRGIFRFVPIRRRPDAEANR